jgi:hypothetical protein
MSGPAFPFRETRVRKGLKTPPDTTVKTTAHSPESTVVNQIPDWEARPGIPQEEKGVSRRVPSPFTASTRFTELRSTLFRTG